MLVVLYKNVVGKNVAGSDQLTSLTTVTIPFTDRLECEYDGIFT